jgi:hypothetical protein
MNKKDEKVRFTLELTGKANEKLEQLARSSGGNKSEVLRKAIALLEVAAEAEDNGQHLAVANKNNEVVHTIIGL